MHDQTRSYDPPQVLTLDALGPDPSLEVQLSTLINNIAEVIRSGTSAAEVDTMQGLFNSAIELRYRQFALLAQIADLRDKFESYMDD